MMKNNLIVPGDTTPIVDSRNKTSKKSIIVLQEHTLNELQIAITQLGHDMKILRYRGKEEHDRLWDKIARLTTRVSSLENELNKKECNECGNTICNL